MPSLILSCSTVGKLKTSTPPAPLFSSKPHIRLTQRQHAFQVIQHTAFFQITTQITGAHRRILTMWHRYQHAFVSPLLRLCCQADPVLPLSFSAVCPAI